VGSVPAVAGVLQYQEGIAWPIAVTCFRVQAVDGSSLGPAAETCFKTPPTLDVRATPLAPDTGGTVSNNEGGVGRWSPHFGLAAAVVGIGAAAVMSVLRRRDRSSTRRQRD
jgi:hypothetical protein